MYSDEGTSKKGPDYKPTVYYGSETGIREGVQGFSQFPENRDGRYVEAKRNDLSGEIAVATGLTRDNKKPCHRERYDTGVLDGGKYIIRREIGANGLPYARDGPVCYRSRQ